MGESHPRLQHQGRLIWPGAPTVGLVVPESVDAVPPEAAAMYPQIAFAARGIGLSSLSVAGYEEAIPRIVPAARALAARGANAIMVIGTSLTFFRGAAFDRALTGRDRRRDRPALGNHERCAGRWASRGWRETCRRGDRLFGRGQCIAGGVPAAKRIEVLSMRTIKVAERVGEAARITENDIFAAGTSACEHARGADGLLIVCGGLRTLDITPRIEARCGIPVVSSMPAALRKAAQLAGEVAALPEGYGRLLSGAMQQAVP